MDVQEVMLTPGDRKILESYETLLDGLQNYLGQGFEIVLHSLEDFEHSVVKIANGHHTGRKVGAPITDLALSMLQKMRSQGAETSISYFTNNKKGEPLKACTIVIRGEEKRVIGLLCINLYLNTSLVDFFAVFSQPQRQPVLFESFGETSTELIEQTVERTRRAVMEDATVPTSLKNREIVTQLQDQGIFRIKNAVKLVADGIGISPNTVYLHLRNLGL